MGEVLRGILIFLSGIGGIMSLISAAGYLVYRSSFQNLEDRREDSRGLLPTHVLVMSVGVATLCAGRVWQAIEFYHALPGGYLWLSIAGFFLMDVGLLLVLLHVRRKIDSHNVRKILASTSELKGEKHV
jgi:hypothetical protein